MTTTDGWPHGRIGRAFGRYIWLWAAVWLIYMIDPVKAAWHHPETLRRASGIAIAVLFSVLYLVGFVRVRYSFRTRYRRLDLAESIAIVGGMAGLAVLLAAIIGQPAMGSLVYVAVMSIFLFPTRLAWSMVAGYAVLILVVTRVVPGWKPDDNLAFVIAVASLAVWGTVRLVERNAQLDEARQEIARLAVSAERDRFARDLHDLLGHSLTVVSVKAELAGRLVPIAPERAQAEIADIQRLTREALADVRTAVGGYRDASLGAELVRARSALEAAEIEPELPTTIDNVSEGRQELFGWAVREGVTNVVRHSGAKRCWIRLTPTSVIIEDDGTGPGAPVVEGAGHGLDGLRQRVSLVDGSGTVGRSSRGGFALRVTIP
jgi:two-component system, NarL family, sensor histidine kinase DesK